MYKCSWTSSSWLLKTFHPSSSVLQPTCEAVFERFTSVWHNTGEPANQAKTQQFTYILRRRDTLLRTVIYRIEESREPSMLNLKKHL